MDARRTWLTTGQVNLEKYQSMRHAQRFWKGMTCYSEFSCRSTGRIVLSAL